MPPALDFTTTVKNGSIPDQQWAWIKDHLKLYEGSEVRLRASKPKRSSLANSYYWKAVINPIRKAMIESGVGYMHTDEGVFPVTSGALHHWFKSKYLPVRVEVVFGEEVTLPPTTTELDSTDFYYYIESVKTDEQVLQLGVHFESSPTSLRSYSITDL